MDQADPWIPCRRRGKQLHHGGNVCGIVALGLTVYLGSTKHDTLCGIILLKLNTFFCHVFACPQY
jgi:hypothetical protein